jgi:hypothetical protein
MKYNIDRLPFTLPEQINYEQAWGLALKLAVDQLSTIKDIESLCYKSGANYQLIDSKEKLSLAYFNKLYNISFPDIIITQTDSNQPVELKDKILILHYILRAKGTSLSHKLIAFQEFKEGTAYYPSFFQRSIKPMIDYFGPCPEKLITISKELGGSTGNLGDISVTIPSFSKIPLTYVFWKGDEEFPPNANLLFDNSVLDYLPIEDVVVLCQTLTWKLIKSLPTISKI